MEYLNSINPNIQFTYKYSSDCIEFLDVLVKREGQSLTTDLFVKETLAFNFKLANGEFRQGFQKS